MIIAEIGLNHLGSEEYLNEYLETLLKSSVDAVTLQVREPEFYKNTDFSEFVGNFNSMDYFGGILYPVPGSSQGILNGENASALLQAYAAIENVNVVNQAGLEPAVTSTTYTDMVNLGMSLPQNNPYFSNSKSLSPYNWNGVYNKRTNSSGNLNFYY